MFVTGYLPKKLYEISEAVSFVIRCALQSIVERLFSVC